MGIRLQMLHALMEAHPDRAERLRPHVLALEVGIVAEPALCLHRVRALFEAVHETIAPLIGADLTAASDFPQRNKRIIEALNFAVKGHPNAEDIDDKIRRLLGSINGMAAALAELSNIPNLRHGGSLDWGTLERQHATMLGGLCDTLVSFLFEIAWNRQPASQEVEIGVYEEFTDFNDNFDEQVGFVEVYGSDYSPSRIIFHLERSKYDLIRKEWGQDPEPPAKPDEAAA